MDGVPDHVLSPIEASDQSRSDFTRRIGLDNSTRNQAVTALAERFAIGFGDDPFVMSWRDELNL